MEDIKRTFMYHGSEHKCINCIEHGLELNVANVRSQLQGAQALWHQLYYDRYGHQYPVFHGDPYRYHLAAHRKPYRADPGDRRRFL